MAKPSIACCDPYSVQGAARLHWYHSRSCVLLPRHEIEVKSTHPAGTARYIDIDTLPWFRHPTGCLCERCVFVELNLDRDDDLGIEDWDRV